MAKQLSDRLKKHGFRYDPINKEVYVYYTPVKQSIVTGMYEPVYSNTVIFANTFKELIDKCASFYKYAHNYYTEYFDTTCGCTLLLAPIQKSPINPRTVCTMYQSATNRNQYIFLSPDSTRHTAHPTYPIHIHHHIPHF